MIEPNENERIILSAVRRAQEDDLRAWVAAYEKVQYFNWLYEVCRAELSRRHDETLVKALEEKRIRGY